MTPGLRAAAAAALLLPLLLAGCKQRPKKTAARTAGEAASVIPDSTIYAGDPQAAVHFLKGFYQIEGNSWRWTAKAFAVRLAPPLNAAQNGAELVAHLAVPEAIIQNLHSTTLSASIAGLNLGSEQYSKPGKYTYVRTVPGERLQTGAVTVNFVLDHVLPPGKTDARELGIFVSDVGLVAK